MPALSVRYLRWHEAAHAIMRLLSVQAGYFVLNQRFLNDLGARIDEGAYAAAAVLILFASGAHSAAICWFRPLPIM